MAKKRKEEVSEVPVTEESGETPTFEAGAWNDDDGDMPAVLSSCIDTGDSSLIRRVGDEIVVNMIRVGTQTILSIIQKLAGSKFTVKRVDYHPSQYPKQEK